MDFIYINKTVSRPGKDKIRVDDCIFRAFEDLGMICVDNGSMSKYRFKKSIGALDYIKGEWRKRMEKENKRSRDLYIKSSYLEIYDKMMEDIGEVCRLSKEDDFDSALKILTKCRAKLKRANHRVDSILKRKMRWGKISSDIEEIRKFAKGERISYKLFDMEEKVIERTLSEIDDIFKNSILNRGWDDPAVNTGKEWELCACGGGGFFVKREYLKPLDPKLPPGTSIEVEECPACDQDAGVRGLREKRHSSAPSRSQHPSYREHIKEIFGDDYFHPDML